MASPRGNPLAADVCPSPPFGNRTHRNACLPPGRHRDASLASGYLDRSPFALRCRRRRGIRWTRLLESRPSLEELYVDDHSRSCWATARRPSARTSTHRRSPSPLILRHSWHPDDPACMLKRLKLRVGHA